MYLTENLSRNETLIHHMLKQAVSEPISKVKPIENARTSYVYDVNDHLIVKFPSRRTVISDWEAQSKNAPVLQSLLSFKIPQPKLKEVLLSSASPCVLTSMSYEKIPGRILSSGDFVKQPVEFKQHFFEQLSDAAIQLHSIDPQKLPVPPLRSEQVVRRMLPISQKNKLFDALVYLFLYFPVFGFDHAPQRVLCHSDLHSKNVCLDEKNNLVGLLDFDTLNQGVYFSEFRPLLYRDEKDTQMFRQIYEKRSGRKISDKDLRWMDVMFKMVCVSSSVARVTKVSSFKKQRSLPQKKH